MASGSHDTKIPQWAVLLACGALAFLGQYVFVLLTSKATSTELATHELTRKIDVQRADFEALRRQSELAFQQLNAKVDQLSIDVAKRLDKFEAKQEEMQRLFMQQQQPPASRPYPR